MDRPERGLIKWSPNANHDSFLYLNLQHRVVQLYEPTGHAHRGRFDYEKRGKHDVVPPLTTYDWSPLTPGLVAVGSSNGSVNLLRVDDDSNDYRELRPKVARNCLAVAFNTTGLLAVGLDRVRNDPCLHIWDVNRLSTLHETGPGFSSIKELERDPMRRLEHNASISSIKFFEDNPRTLVVGIKGSGLRIHDLREGNDSVITFQTKCNNNLAIDYADQNYFTSSALDSPGVLVWDRRALSRSVASKSYLDALENDDMPLGGALKLDRAMEMESDPQARSARSSFIRKIAYCRDKRGKLAVLSRTGQLKVFSTLESAHRPVDVESEGPRLLQVRRSSEMDNFYSEADRSHERIVSFDWITMPSPLLRPRLLVLRHNGAFEVLEMPAETRAYHYKLSPWQAPYRGMTGEEPYHSLMKFEPAQTAETLGPFFRENALSDIPIFGPEKADVGAIADAAVQTYSPEGDLLIDEAASDVPLPEAFTKATTIAEKLKALRAYIWGISYPDVVGRDDFHRIFDQMMLIKTREDWREGPSKPSNHELHERLLKSTMETSGFPKAAQAVLDHVMLLRAKEKYLFDCRVNRAVVADDPWLKSVWGWIEDAEEACADGGMLAHPLDLSYLGVQTIWTEDLGERPTFRLVEGSGPPDRATWSRCLSAICKKRQLGAFDGVETTKPYHRQLLLDICAWGASAALEDSMPDVGLENKGSGRIATWYTRMTALALFRGDSQEAVRVLKEGSKAHPELLFVSLALQLVSRGDRHEAATAAEQLDFDEVVAAKTDPYLRAISSFIATGDWAPIASQRSLPLRDRTFVAVRNFDDDQLTAWLAAEVAEATREGDIEAIVLTGITEQMVDVLATYVARFHDVQTATLVMSFGSPRYVDDHRCTAWRNAYRAYLQRHKAFYQRTKFEVESTKRSKREANGSGRPEIKPPSRQIALRCVYCDAETSLLRSSSSANVSGGVGGIPGPFGSGIGGGGGRHHSSSSSSLANNNNSNNNNNNNNSSNIPLPPPPPPPPTSLPNTNTNPTTSSSSSNNNSSNNTTANPPSSTAPTTTTDKILTSTTKNNHNPSSSSGIACPNCKRHLPRCVVCLEVVGIPRSDLLYSSSSSTSSAPPSSFSLSGGGAAGAGGGVGGVGEDHHHHHHHHPDALPGPGPGSSNQLAMRFPTFCLRCEHVLHLDHARQWFARHNECPVPECRCRCNFRANPELNYH